MMMFGCPNVGFGNGRRSFDRSADRCNSKNAKEMNGSGTLFSHVRSRKSQVRFGRILKRFGPLAFNGSTQVVRGQITEVRDQIRVQKSRK